MSIVLIVAEQKPDGAFRKATLNAISAGKQLAEKAGAELHLLALAKDAAELAEELDKYHSELGKLLQPAIMFDVEQAFKAALAAQHARVGNARQNLKRMAGSGQFAPKEMQELSDELTEMAGSEQDHVSMPAGQIADVARLLARSDLFVKLAKRQAAIALMLCGSSRATLSRWARTADSFAR